MNKINKGFTIVETAIAMVILAVVAMTTYTLCMSSSLSVEDEEMKLEFASIFSDLHTFNLRYADEWNYYYYGDDVSDEEGVHYYDVNFNEVEDVDIGNTAFYKLQYKKTDGGITVNVVDLSTEEYVFTNYLIEFKNG